MGAASPQRCVEPVVADLLVGCVGGLTTGTGAESIVTRPWP